VFNDDTEFLDFPVERIESGGLNLDENLPSTRLGNIDGVDGKVAKLGF